MIRVLLNAIPGQRTVISLIVFQTFPADEIVLHLPGLAIKVPELMEGRIILQKFSLIICISRFDQHRIRFVQTVLVTGIEEFIQAPSHVLLILCKRTFMDSLPRGKNSNILIDKECTEIVTDALCTHTGLCCRIVDPL